MYVTPLGSSANVSLKVCIYLWSKFRWPNLRETFERNLSYFPVDLNFASHSLQAYTNRIDDIARSWVVILVFTIYINACNFGLYIEHNTQNWFSFTFFLCSWTYASWLDYWHHYHLWHHSLNKLLDNSQHLSLNWASFCNPTFWRLQLHIFNGRL